MAPPILIINNFLSEVFPYWDELLDKRSNYSTWEL